MKLLGNLLKLIIIITLSYFVYLQLMNLSSNEIILSGLQVLNLGNQKLEVLIDGNSFGEISPNSDISILNQVQPGIHDIEITNKDNLKYPKYSASMKFISNMNNFIAYYPGPNESSSFGWSLEALQSNSLSSSLNLEIITDINYTVNVAAAYAESKNISPIGNTSIYDIQLDQLKGIKVYVKSSGFADMDMQIFDASKAKLVGGKYRLTIKLLELPI